MQTDSERSFDVASHLLRDQWTQAADTEVERLRADQRAMNDEYDRRIERLMASKAAVRAATDPVCGLPKLPSAAELDDPRVTEIAARFAALPAPDGGEKAEAA